MQSGQVPAWRARTVAETTIHTTPALTREAAAFVDAQVAAVAGRIGPAQLDRLVAETIKRYDLAAADPATDPEDGYLSVDPRHATLHDEDVHFAGTMRFEAELDIADALDLDHALTQKAAEQKALGSTESLDVRRAKALGDLARTQTALDLAWPSERHRDDDLPAAREVVLHAHFDASTVGEQTVFGPTGRMEEGQRLILLDQLTSWCGDSRTKITIKPVIDLNAHWPHPATTSPTGSANRSSSGPHLRVPVVHQTGPRLRHRPRHRLRPRRRKPKADHNPAYDVRQPRRLCRFHHRLKTHTAWRYRVTGPGASSGPAPTATTSDATAPAPPRSTEPTRIHPASHDPADDDPAPHPASPHDGGAVAMLERPRRMLSEARPAPAPSVATAVVDVERDVFGVGVLDLPTRCSYADLHPAGRVDAVGRHHHGDAVLPAFICAGEPLALDLASARMTEDGPHLARTAHDRPEVTAIRCVDEDVRAQRRGSAKVAEVDLIPSAGSTTSGPSSGRARSGSRTIRPPPASATVEARGRPTATKEQRDEHDGPARHPGRRATSGSWAPWRSRWRRRWWSRTSS